MEELHWTTGRLVRHVTAYREADRVSVIESLAADAEPAVRMRAPDVAAELNYPHLLQMCVGLLADPVWYVRCAACERLYLASLPAPAGLLLGLVESDPHEIVRWWAAFVLGGVAGADDVPRMLALAEVVQGENHEGTTVRQTLLEAVEAVRACGS